MQVRSHHSQTNPRERPLTSMPGSFAKAVGHEGEAEAISAKDFDPRGEYKDVLELVGKEGQGQVKVFRVEAGGARCFYYVVVPDGKGRVVGVRAQAVES